jgi:hypothetical protein
MIPCGAMGAASPAVDEVEWIIVGKRLLYHADLTGALRNRPEIIDGRSAAGASSQLMATRDRRQPGGRLHSVVSLLQGRGDRIIRPKPFEERDGIPRLLAT